jgi:predicted outer membrane repeat protein
MPDRYVKNGGSNTNDGLSWATAFATIQQGVDDLKSAAQTGGTVHVQRGDTFPEHVRMSGADYSNITVMADGALPGPVVEGPPGPTAVCAGKPIVTGSFSGRVFLIEDVSGVALVDLTIRSGRVADSGGGVAIRRSHVDLRGCCIVGNFADLDGGGVWFDACKVSGKTCHVQDCLFAQNHALRNGGGGHAYDTRWLEVVRTRFEDNAADTGGGGGLLIEECSHVTIKERCVFSKNLAIATPGALAAPSQWGMGGGVLLWKCGKAPATITITDECTFEQNKASQFGGGVAAAHRSYATIERTTFNKNDGGSGGALAMAQAIFAVGGFTMDLASTLAAAGKLVTVRQCDFVENTAQNNGGAVYATTEACVHFEHGTFDQNRAQYDGGAISVSFNSEVELRDATTLTDNRALNGNGGALRSRNAEVTTRGARFLDNQAPNGEGGAIYFSTEHETGGPAVAPYDTMLMWAGFRRAYLYVLDGTVFEHNQAARGGGLSLRYKPATFIPDIKLTVQRGNRFEHNRSLSAPEGGAILGVGVTRPSVVGNAFVDNSALFGAFGSGGAIRLYECEKIKVINNAFASNAAGDEGGGMTFADCGRFTLSGNTFAGNRVASVPPLGADLRFVHCALGGLTPAALAAANPGVASVSISP